MLTLSLSEKGGETKHLSFEKDEITVGRVQGNDVVLAKGNVSKRHCRIFSQGGRYQVEDLKSTNGTYVNGRKIGDATVVSSSDKIYVGDFIIKVETAGAEAPATGPIAPEAGSLSTALPRRPPPPPPPPPPRASAAGMRTHQDEDGATSEPGKPRSSGRTTLPPPPPPPSAKRDTGRPFAALSDEPEAPPSPGEVDLDEEALAKPPKLSVPPLKSALASLTDDDDDEDRLEAKTASKNKSPLAAAIATDGVGGSAESLAASLLGRLGGDGVSAVHVGPTGVEIERNGAREPVADVEPSAPLGEALRSLATRGMPRPAGDTGVVVATLAEGVRLVALFPPVADAPCGTLSKPAQSGRSLADLVTDGSLSKEMREVFEACLNTRRNILLAGEGHATDVLLGALATAIPSRYRVVSLAPGLARPAGGRWTTVASERRLPDLVFSAASLRPDYLIVEVADVPTASDALSQCALGQGGVLVTVSGRSASDALARLAALAGPSLGTTSYVRDLVASCFDVVVHSARLADGSVRILEVAEPKLDASGNLAVDPLFTFRIEGTAAEGRVNGRFQGSGGSSRLASTLTARGAATPALARK